MPSIRQERVSRQLAAVQRWLVGIARESESLVDQELADDLYAINQHLEKVVIAAHQRRYGQRKIKGR